MYVCQISLGYLIITRMKCISFQTKQYFSDEVNDICFLIQTKKGKKVPKKG